MLLKFTVQNYRSIREEAAVNFVAATLKEHSEILIPSRYADFGVLPVIVIYGANASGKSNTLLALSRIRQLVINSFRRAESGPINIPKFLLDDYSANEPTRFVVDFINSDIRYQFGTEIDDGLVASEWLYQYPNKTKQILYERTNKEIKFGRALTGSNRQIHTITSPNALFLSAAATSAHPVLTPISNFFRNKVILQLTTDTGTPEGVAQVLEADENLRRDVVGYLTLADTGIADIQIERSEIPEDTRIELTEFMGALKKLIGNPPDEAQLPSDTHNFKIKLGHTSADEKIRFLDYYDESLGTKYLLKLLPPVLGALKTGSVLVLDEITTGLHTLLARRLVSLFHNKNLNKHGAQLVFTTHDTNLLAPGLLRRDEIWFAEKGRDGSTTIFPLTDIATKNTDNIERGYISGRFGGIPFVPDDGTSIHD